ncbi:uncharacterized protein LOC131055382 [Cryptomeria japonica]|uniref:uncharacterized protein LOC131055382 n=1 Tax=Cryptomeria japonica TaxID=3369 RepID=UPI0027DA145A|nr:uncharacterized protein LOC131055382 [Cryptomeria japonica]
MAESYASIADVDDFYEWVSHEEVTRFMTWEPFKSKQHAREYVANVVIPHPWNEQLQSRDGLQGITRIEALDLPENVASAGVLEKAGFIKDGLLSNYVYLKGSLMDCFLFSFAVSTSIL